MAPLKFAAAFRRFKSYRDRRRTGRQRLVRLLRVGVPAPIARCVQRDAVPYFLRRAAPVARLRRQPCRLLSIARVRTATRISSLNGGVDGRIDALRKAKKRIATTKRAALDADALRSADAGNLRPKGLQHKG